MIGNDMKYSAFVDALIKAAESAQTRNPHSTHPRAQNHSPKHWWNSECTQKVQARTQSFRNFKRIGIIEAQTKLFLKNVKKSPGCSFVTVLTEKLLYLHYGQWLDGIAVNIVYSTSLWKPHHGSLPSFQESLLLLWLFHLHLWCMIQI